MKNKWQLPLYMSKNRWNLGSESVWSKVNDVWVSNAGMLGSQFRIACGKFMKSFVQWEVTVLFWCSGQTNMLVLQSIAAEKSKAKSSEILWLV